jgi:hypothetical protein
MENFPIGSPPGEQPKGRRKLMPNKSKTSLTADEIAEKAARGEDVSQFFINEFSVVRPIHRVNVDLIQGMLRELDA